MGNAKNNPKAVLPPPRLYHASVHRKEEFGPLTHFGTLHSALERAATRARAGFPAWFYPVTLAVAHPMPARDGASLSHSPSVFAAQAQRLGVLSAEEATLVGRESVIGEIGADAVLLVRLLHRKGHDGFYYRNLHEARGTLSWCNFDASQVAMATEPFMLDIDEIEAVLDEAKRLGARSDDELLALLPSPAPTPGVAPW